MRRLLPALFAAALLVGAIATADEPVATAAATCSGSVTQKIAGTTIRATSISTTKVSCRAGKAVLRRFLSRVGASPKCRTAASAPAPTAGCVVSRYHCVRNRTPDYCATVSGRTVEWRERHVLSGRPPRAAG